MTNKKVKTVWQKIQYRGRPYRALMVIGIDSIAAINFQGSQWTIVEVGGTKLIARYYHGNHKNVAIFLQQENEKILAEQEKARKWEEDRPIREAEERRKKHLAWLDIKGPGLYITPLCAPEDLKTDKEDPEPNPFGPFQDNNENGLEENGLEDRADAEEFYWEAYRTGKKSLKLIEAANRDDALKGIGHVWIDNGLEKGPPVDPRQVTLPFDLGLPRRPIPRQPPRPPQPVQRFMTPTRAPQTPPKAKSTPVKARLATTKAKKEPAHLAKLREIASRYR